MTWSINWFLKVCLAFFSFLPILFRQPDKCTKIGTRKQHHKVPGAFINAFGMTLYQYYIAYLTKQKQQKPSFILYNDSPRSSHCSSNFKKHHKFRFEQKKSWHGILRFLPSISPWLIFSRRSRDRGGLIWFFTYF